MNFISLQKLRDNKQLSDICRQLAHLHIEGSPEDLMSRLGSGFLENLFYRSLARSDQAITYVAMDGETVAGFAAAALDLKEFLKQSMFTQPFLSARYGLTSLLLRPNLWVRFIEAMQIEPQAEAKGAAEILMVVVEHEYRGKGLSTQLLSMVNDDLKNRGIKSCVARVRVNKSSALRMYDSCGYEEIGSVIFNNSPWKWLMNDFSTGDKSVRSEKVHNG